MKIITILAISIVSMNLGALSENYIKYEHHISDREGKQFALEETIFMYQDTLWGEERFFNNLYKGRTEYWKLDASILCGRTPQATCPQTFPKITLQEVLIKEYQNTNIIGYVGSVLFGLMIFIIFILRNKRKVIFDKGKDKEK